MQHCSRSTVWAYRNGLVNVVAEKGITHDAAEVRCNSIPTEQRVTPGKSKGTNILPRPTLSVSTYYSYLYSFHAMQTNEPMRDIDFQRNSTGAVERFSATLHRWHVVVENVRVARFAFLRMYTALRTLHSYRPHNIMMDLCHM